MQLRISGLPKPQGSKRVFNGRVVEAAGAPLKVWRKAIADACIAQARPSLILGPVEVSVVFYLPRPKTVKESDRKFPIVPPDIDKLARALLDGIGQSEAVWGDDSQVIELKAVKVYGTDFTGADVKITEL